MSKIDVIRAWKDPEYRSSLSENQRAMLPDSPAGALDLSDSELDSVLGGSATVGLICPSFLGPCTGLDICRLTLSTPFCGDPAPLL
jgi:mersacidin/lichenicidin family type 2 lantibiotic